MIGSILGDGYLHWNGYRGTSLEVRQQEAHGDYLQWLYRELGELCYRSPYLRHDNHQWRLYTRYLPELTELRQTFYQNGRKVVPEEIGRYLTDPITLAVWFMEDGTSDQRIGDHCSLYLVTNCFNRSENEQLCHVLAENFGVTTAVHSSLMRGKRYYRLYIGAAGRERFVKLIEPYVVSSFRYKLPSALVAGGAKHEPPSIIVTPQRLIPRRGEIGVNFAPIKRRLPNGSAKSTG